MNRTAKLALFSILILASTPSYSLPIYGASVDASGFNQDDGRTLPGTSFFINTLGGTASINSGSQTYQDLRNYGLESNIPTTTTITYSGEASASSTGLRSRVSGQQSSVLFIPSETDILDTGLAQYDATSSARFRDNLSVTGASDLTSIQFDVNLSGTRANAIFGSFIQVNNGSDVLFASNDSMWNGINDFNIVLDSNELTIVDGMIDINLSLLTSLGFFLGGEAFDTELNNVLREVDFFNTLTINQFRGFNTTGQLVDLSSVIGSDGQVYDSLRVSTVPIPPAAILFGSSLLALFGARKRSAKI